MAKKQLAFVDLGRIKNLADLQQIVETFIAYHGRASLVEFDLGGKNPNLSIYKEPKEKKVVPEFDYTHLLKVIKKNPLNLNVINHLKKIAKHLNKMDILQMFMHPSNAMKNKLKKLIAETPKLGRKEKLNTCRHDKNMVRVAIDNFKRHESSESSDFGMIGMYFDDAANHLMIGRYIALNEFNKAAKLAHDIDTAPRDDIPESTWDFITSYE